MQIKTLLSLSALTFIAGIILFAWRNEWIIIHIPAWFRPMSGEHVGAINKKTVSVSFYKNDNWHMEQIETIWEQDGVAKNSTRLAGIYFSLLYEEALTEQKIGTEAAATDSKGTTLYLSLTHNPLPTEATVKEKLMIIEGLLRTLRESIPSLAKLILLVHHQPLTDYHLDFTQTWPLEGFINDHGDHGADSTYQRPQPTQKFKLLLDPTGDAQYTGRTIDDTFERGVSLQIAQELKHVLEDLYPEVSCVLTRIPGETVEPLQNATFANRLPANLFVHIGVVSHTKPLPIIATYIMSSNRSILAQPGASASLSFEPYTQAHEAISAVSYAQAQVFVHALKSQGSEVPATIVAPRAFPFHPLVGMHVPALGIEITVKSKDELKSLILPIARALGKLSAPQA